MPDIQFQVYGINLLVRLMAEPPAEAISNSIALSTLPPGTFCGST